MGTLEKKGRSSEPTHREQRAHWCKKMLARLAIGDHRVRRVRGNGSPHAHLRGFKVDDVIFTSREIWASLGREQRVYVGLIGGRDQGATGALDLFYLSYCHSNFLRSDFSSFYSPRHNQIRPLPIS